MAPTQIMIEGVEDRKRLSASLLVQHNIMEITLNGPALILTILTMMISIQILQPSFTCTLLALAPLPMIVHNDFRNFMNLGPGGTPSTFFGYLKIAYLRMYALSDPYTPASAPKEMYPLGSCHPKSQAWLPIRSGPRPTIAGIAPQRQIDQPGCPEMYLKLRSAIERIAARRPESLKTEASCFEKKGLALFTKNPINETCRGEICHVHDSDHSMHMNLHPEDAKVVLEQGWGERHPLARGGWMKQYVPREFVMVYAPRNESELETVLRIIEAAAYWSSGEHFHLELC